jgi:hypothetical protein
LFGEITERDGCIDLTALLLSIKLFRQLLLRVALCEF